ncbi:MAG: helix-turn-helix transcriptional regulator [Firmicutes bacterium]|nr:helix-turn-helix transcriptional regulator [Bacillota bacterium]
MDNKVKICKLLKDERIARNITQKEMAKKLGYKSKSSYSLIENGRVKVTLEQFINICKVLEITKREILKIVVLFIDDEVA